SRKRGTRNHRGEVNPITLPSKRDSRIDRMLDASGFVIHVHRVQKLNELTVVALTSLLRTFAHDSTRPVNVPETKRRGPTLRIADRRLRGTRTDQPHQSQKNKPSGHESPLF